MLVFFLRFLLENILKIRLLIRNTELELSLVIPTGVAMIAVNEQRKKTPLLASDKTI